MTTEPEDYDDKDETGWKVCTCCKTELVHLNQDICEICFCYLEHKREAEECDECLNAKLPHSDYCYDCENRFQELDAQYDQEQKGRCACCNDKHLPNSFLCRNCEDWVNGWEKEQWRNVKHSFLSMLRWTLAGRIKHLLQRFKR